MISYLRVTAHSDGLLHATHTRTQYIRATAERLVIPRCVSCLAMKVLQVLLLCSTMQFSLGFSRGSPNSHSNVLGNYYISFQL